VLEHLVLGELVERQLRPNFEHPPLHVRLHLLVDFANLCELLPRHDVELAAVGFAGVVVGLRRQRAAGRGRADRAGMREAKDLAGGDVGGPATPRRLRRQPDRQRHRDGGVRRDRVEHLPERRHDGRLLGVDLDADQLPRRHQPARRARHDAGEHFVWQRGAALHPPRPRHDRQASRGRDRSAHHVINRSDTLVRLL